MKNLLIGGLCLSFLVGCQSYPAKPNQVSSWSKRVVVNRTVPDELKPYELPEKVEYVNDYEEVPTLIIVKKGVEYAR